MEIMDNTKLRISYNIKNHCSLFLNNPNIIGFARGNKIINGVMTDVPALMIYVKKKLMPSAINSYNFIPKYFNGIVTDIYESGEVELSTNEIRPAVGGIEIGTGGQVGTLGYAVTDYKKEKLYILTCAHVVAPSSKVDSPPQIINQPYHGSEIGKVEKVIPKKLYDAKDVQGIKNVGITDAALVYVGKNTAETQNKILSPMLSNKVVILGTSKVQAGNSVWKFGITTGLTWGSVIGIEGTIIYGGIDKKNYVATNLISTKIKLAGGDSGAIGMVGNTKKAFGMLCTGTTNLGSFSAIDDVLKALEVEIAQPIA